jgi:hypothetical protein
LLYLSNYKYPRITADEIIEILKQHEFELTPEAEAFLLAALGPDYAADSVLVVAAELIAGIFRRPLPPTKDRCTPQRDLGFAVAYER